MNNTIKTIAATALIATATAASAGYQSDYNEGYAKFVADYSVANTTPAYGVYYADYYDFGPMGFGYSETPNQESYYFDMGPFDMMFSW